MESKVESLQEQLAKKDRDLQLAAEIGKQLLETNNELSKQLENFSSEGSAKVEVCSINIPLTSCCYIQ